MLAKSLAAAALLAIALPAAAEPGWADYGNARFQYHICYPTAVFTPQEEAPNGDGRGFTTGDGASLIVYGRNNALDENVAATARETASRLAGPAGKTTYSAVRADRFAVSGAKGGKIFYAKGFYRDQQYKIFEMTYPAALAAKYNRIVDKISSCFANTEG